MLLVRVPVLKTNAPHAGASIFAGGVTSLFLSRCLLDLRLTLPEVCSHMSNASMIAFGCTVESWGEVRK